MKNSIKHLFMLCLFGMISMGAKAEDIPNNEIWYEASTRLIETTSETEDKLGLHTDAFNTTIKSHTFSNGKGKITFYADVTSIGDKAFSSCAPLTSVTIPNSVTSIGKMAFYNCLSLEKVNITDLDKWAEIEFAYFEANPLHCAHNLYLNGQLVTNAELTTAKKISSYAFYGCSGLKSVTIGNSVTSIGSYAFYECSGLKSVTIPNSVTSIGSYAFFYCTGLTSVNITDLDKWAEIEFANYEGNPLLYAHNLYLNEQVVKNATLKNAKKISSYAFFECKGLTSVTIPNSVTSIGSSAFEHCSGLTSVEIPNSVTTIGKSAFYDCSGLTSVTIPNSVTSIGDYVFWGCSGLKNIIADGINAPTTSSYCFSDVTDCYLHVPSGSKESYESNFGNFKSGSGNKIETYSAYSKSNAGVYSFEEWGSSSDVTLSEGIEKVYVPVEASVKTLQYKRTFSNTDWQALYVPFELDVKTDLANFDVYKISTSSADAINVTLMTEGKTSANTPYLIKAKTTGEQTIPVSSKTVKVTVENTNSDLTDFEIVGTYEKLNYGDIAGDWYALKGGKFMKAGEGAYLNPYRFYLKHKASSSKESIEINFNEPTGITSYDNPSHRQAQGKLGSGQAQNENENLYNLNGMRVDSNYKGIVIINGKKYLKK